MTTPLQALREHGQSPWIDFIARDFIRGGELERLVEKGIVGLTSNPTIFQQAIAEGNAYDDQLREVMQEVDDPREVFFRLAVEDIKEACDKLRPVFDRGESTRDGWVSMEVDPDLASDAEATLKEAKRIHGEIGKPNLFVKIPGTEAGLQAIEETIAAGIPVNVTLLFSLERHRLAAEAYLRGLRRLRESGGDLATVASVASFFVSRVDSEADKQIEEKGAPAELKGKLAIANAKLAYQTYLDLFSGSDWEDLATAGASPQRCLWASTSTKNPEYRDVIYVEELIGEQTVNTMPPKTAEAFDDHGKVEDTLERGIEEARETLSRFAEAGIDYDEVVETLEREGVQKFADSFKELIEGVAAKRDELVAA
jgi:transaldolase